MRVWAKVVPRVVRAKSYRGYPSNRQEELELDINEVNDMRKTIKGKPLRYNHDDNTNIGSVGDDRICSDGSWDMRLDFSNDNAKGRRCIQYIKAGLLRGVSLKHRAGSNEPLEVSLCLNGARGPESALMLDRDNNNDIISASMLYRDSNTNLYTRYRTENESIEASQHEDTPQDDTLSIFEATIMSTSDEQSTTPVAVDAAAVPEVELTETEAAAARLVAFPSTNGAMTAMNGPGIISRADKDSLINTVYELESEKKNGALMIEELKAKAIEDAATIASLRASHDVNKQETVEIDKALVGDMAAAFTPPDELQRTRQILASMDTPTTALFARISQNIQAAQQAKPPAAASVMASAMATKMNNWMSSKKTTNKRSFKAMETEAHAVPVDAAVVVSASVSYNKRWGAPLAYRPIDYVVAASNGSKCSNEAAEIENKLGAYDRGTGCNFDHDFMTLNQRNFFFKDKRKGTNNLIFCIADQGFSKLHMSLRKQFRGTPDIDD